MEYHLEIDARNLKCPLPILRCKKGLSEVPEGAIVKIVATDPGSVKDFHAFCKQTENEMLEFDDANGEFTFFIKKRFTKA